MTNDVIILQGSGRVLDEGNARKIVEFMGARATEVRLAEVPDAASLEQRLSACSALIVHADILAEMTAALAGLGPQGILGVIGNVPYVFVYVFDGTAPRAGLVQMLSLGGLVAVQRLDRERLAFRVPDGNRECCGPFTGLSFETADAARDSAFVEGTPDDRRSVLVEVAGKPFFVRVRHERSSIFLVACRELANLDEATKGETGLLPWFSRLFPLMVFLRIALGDKVWHGDTPRACLIIDDPQLKKRYGFFAYEKLLRATAGRPFSASIGFIPWNYRRSRRDVAGLLSRTRALSLCVHGCDHTGAEFASGGFDALLGKAKLALERMRIHQQTSGVPFDDVMVFPQGLFSTEAPRALRANGYLAAVSTDLWPADKPDALTLRDFVEVAVTKFGDFPLFGRHYPMNVTEFAFDLFLGKPALIVEHHGYFRNGYEALASFVARLNAVDNRLEWRTLAEIFSTACLKKAGPEGEVHVRFYTGRFRLVNTAPVAQTFVLSRRHTEAELPAVTVDNRTWDCEQQGEDLVFRVTLDGGAAANIEVAPRNLKQAAASSWKPGGRYRTAVLLRRLLCDLRDNYLETNRVLAGPVLRCVTLLRRRPVAYPAPHDGGAGGQ